MLQTGIIREQIAQFIQTFFQHHVRGVWRQGAVDPASSLTLGHALHKFLDALLVELPCLRTDVVSIARKLRSLPCIGVPDRISVICA